MNTLEWNDTQIDELKMWLKKGLQYQAIARKMGTSKYAISGKVGRLGLRQHRRITTEKYIGRRARIREKEIAQGKLVQEPVKKIVLPEPPPQPKPIIRTKVQPCAFVLSLRPDIRYCDKPSLPGKSYCREHQDLCIQRVPPMKDFLASA